MSIDIHDPQDTLVEKIMGHFGWYKVKKIELPIENLDISYTFITKDNKPEVKRPAAKKFNTRTPKNGN